MSIEVKFANGWYTPPPVQQLRQEFQNVYQILRGGDTVRVLGRDHEVEPNNDWGVHFIANDPLVVYLPPASNGVELVLANHSGGSVSFAPSPGATIVSKDNLVGVDADGAVGAISGGNGVWYLYGALV